MEQRERTKKVCDWKEDQTVSVCVCGGGGWGRKRVASLSPVSNISLASIIMSLCATAVGGSRYSSVRVPCTNLCPRSVFRARVRLSGVRVPCASPSVQRPCSVHLSLCPVSVFSARVRLSSVRVPCTNPSVSRACAQFSLSPSPSLSCPISI